jgi:dethiobiotin synthetase
LIRSCFVTGTDFNVGKTLVASALVNLLRTHGVHTVGMKPAATGATLVHGRWRQQDLEQLAKEGSFTFPGRVLSPYIFADESSAHIAAEMAGVQMRLEEMVDTFDVLTTWADVIVVDGVGGFWDPLGADFNTADLASALNLPVVLVVGIKAGCVNHALLSAEALRARGLELAGWVANMIDAELPEAERHLTALSQRLAAPCLAQIPRLDMVQAEVVAAHLSIDDVLAALSSEAGDDRMSRQGVSARDAAL